MPKKPITITICPECKGIENMNGTTCTIVIFKLCANHKISEYSPYIDMWNEAGK
jgi:hypothetical protein